MNKNNIALLVVRVIGIYLFVHSLDFVSSFGYQLNLFVSSAPTGGILTLILFSLLPFLFLFGVGIYFFFSPLRFARFLLQASSEEQGESELSAVELQRIAFSVVGLILVTFAFPTIVVIIIRSFSSYPYFSSLTSVMLTDLFGSLIRFGLGAWLLLGTSGVIELIQKVRTAGVKRGQLA